MNGSYKIYIRDRETGLRDTILERYTSFSLTLNWGELSKFSVSGASIGTVEVEPGDGLVFYRNNVLLFCGTVETVEAECTDVNANLKEWTVTGYEDSIIFRHYLALADPTEIKFDDDLADNVSGYAWNRMLYYIRRNMGADALADRRISGLTLPESSATGQNTESSIRFATLEKTLDDIGNEVDENGNENGLHARYFCDPDTGAKSIIIKEQRDMTADIIISPQFGNIINWKKTQTIPEVNAVWVVSGSYETGTEGETARLWVYQEDTASVEKFGRIEKVVTKTDVKVVADNPDTPEDETVTQADAYTLLNNEARKTLQEGAYKEKFSGTMVEAPELQFMTHWQCGDLVTCVIDGEKFTTTIKTVEIEYSEGFETVTPTLGENEHGIYSDIYKRLKGLDIRMVQEELNG